jgi:hypothetical protein
VYEVQPIGITQNAKMRTGSSAFSGDQNSEFLYAAEPTSHAQQEIASERPFKQIVHCFLRSERQRWGYSALVEGYLSCFPFEVSFEYKINDKGNGTG